MREACRKSEFAKNKKHTFKLGVSPFWHGVKVLSEIYTLTATHLLGAIGARMQSRSKQLTRSIRVGVISLEYVPFLIFTYGKA